MPTPPIAEHTFREVVSAVLHVRPVDLVDVTIRVRRVKPGGDQPSSTKRSGWMHDRP
ncbi:hypothetical protein [Mesorhizobium waimense]|uniref:hypothetical protein n=1 Tax=Mesorhizobium waimense TaxID=1300307 RepID=UPI001ABF55A0|nr:hypothetical protein [Mesorhizobium waimense]